MGRAEHEGGAVVGAAGLDRRAAAVEVELVETVAGEGGGGGRRRGRGRGSSMKGGRFASGRSGRVQGRSGARRSARVAAESFQERTYLIMPSRMPRHKWAGER